MLLLRGKVQKGAQRGKTLGFPTANIPVHKHIEEGIYLAKVTIHQNRHPERVKRDEGSQSKNKGEMLKQVQHDIIEKDSSALPQNDKTYNALTFIGKAVTFGATKVYAESFLLDFSGNLYGKFITVQLLKKMRDNKKFENADDLVQQMHEDVRNARKFFAPWC